MTMTLKPLSEQTIVITGATSGIGLATTRTAAERGARVILVARDEAALREECDRLRAKGLRADYVPADVGERDQVRNVAETVIARHGGFDTWINDAGVGIYATLEEISDKDHHKTFQTNYWGVVYGTTEALKHLKPKGGAIVNIGSIASDMPVPVLSAYAASKHAVKGFTDSLRQELLHESAPVSLTLIKPSGIHTPFGENAKNYFEKASQVPPPVYHPQIVANAILHAAETPTREIVIGAAGAAQTTFFGLFPKLADRLFSAIFYRTAFHKHAPRRDEEGLHHPGSSGQVLGDQKTPILRISPYTEAQKHPSAAALGAAAALGLAVLWVARARRPA